MIINSIIAGAGGGGSQMFHETGTFSVYGDGPMASKVIPCSNTSLDHYLIIVKAIRSWKKINSVWTEQDSLDFENTTSSNSYLMQIVEAVYPSVTSNDYVSTNGTNMDGITVTSVGVRVNINSTSNAYVVREAAASLSKTTGGFNLSLSTANLFNYCNASAGQTFEYEIWGWNN